MIRILYLITEFDRGGAERALYDIVRHLDRSLFEPQVACLGGPGYYSEKYRALGLPVHHLGLRCAHGPAAALFPLGVARCILRLRRLLRREQIEVLQTFLFHANMVGRLAAALARTPVSIGAVRTAEPRHSHTLVDGLTFGLVRGEICVSEAVRQFQVQRAGLPPQRLFVIPNGVDPGEFPVPAAPFACGAEDSLERRRAARTELGLPPEDPVFAFVGRLCEAKALPDLVSAFRAVLRQRGQTVLALAGDGPLAPALRRTAARRQWAGRVRLLGWLDDPRQLYAAADCFVLSSRTEGMPGVVLEAMASGLPVVCTNAPGCAETVTDGEAGLVVRRGDVRALSAAMLTMLENTGRAAQMGRRGRQRALGQFDLRDMVRLYEGLYSELLAQTHR